MEIHNGENLHYSYRNIANHSFWPNLSILNPKYLIARIVITLTLAPPSTNTPHNIDPLHCTSMIGSHHVHDVHVNTLASVPLFNNLHITLLCPSTLHSIFITLINKTIIIVKIPSTRSKSMIIMKKKKEQQNWQRKLKIKKLQMNLLKSWNLSFPPQI
jgi:hypothetical protein